MSPTPSVPTRRQPTATTDRALTNLAATHRLGALLNGIDALGKRAGVRGLPAEVRLTAASLHLWLDNLDLTRGDADLAAQVWSDVP